MLRILKGLLEHVLRKIISLWSCWDSTNVNTSLYHPVETTYVFWKRLPKL